MKVEVYKSEPGEYNLSNYEDVYQNFDWNEVEKAFHGIKQGKSIWHMNV